MTSNTPPAKDEDRYEYVGCLPLLLMPHLFDKFHIYDTLHPFKFFIGYTVSLRNVDNILHVWCVDDGSKSYKKRVNKWNKLVDDFFGSNNLEEYMDRLNGIK